MMVSGGPTHVQDVPSVAAGSPAIMTVGTPGRIGPPTWGTSAVTMGQTCMSLVLAAGGTAVS